jgi:dienelactone hydrolase
LNKQGVLLTGLFLFPLLAGTAFAAGDGQSHHDLARLLKPLTTAPPPIHTEPALDKGEIRALFYGGLPYEGRPTRVFAYFGIPAGADAEHKVPGMVLVHGGGGTAYHEWVRIWNERGYAAIAMDLEGHAPVTNTPWAGPARLGIFQDANLPLTNQWTYHAVADVMLAHSLLAAQPGVNAKKIGVTGISWGGVLAGIVAGVDARFKFAAPVYGCGFLYDSGSFFGGPFRDANAADFAARRKWDPANYFPATAMPMLWVNGDQDPYFSVDITSRSHQAVKGRSFLSIHPAMPHAHPPGWAVNSVPEVYAFADRMLKRGEALPRITRQPSGTNVLVKYASPRPITNAAVWFVTGPLAYQGPDRRIPTFTWQRLDAAVNSKSRTLTVTLPAEAKAYYVNITDSRGLTASANLTCVGK